MEVISLWNAVAKLTGTLMALGAKCKNDSTETQISFEGSPDRIILRKSYFHKENKGVPTEIDFTRPMYYSVDVCFDNKRYVGINFNHSSFDEVFYEFIDAMAFFIDRVPKYIFESYPNAKIIWLMDECLLIKGAFLNQLTRESYKLFKVSRDLVRVEYGRWVGQRKRRNKANAIGYKALLRLKNDLPHAFKRQHKLGLSVRKSEEVMYSFQVTCPSMEGIFEDILPYANDPYQKIREWERRIVSYQKRNQEICTMLFSSPKAWV